jgi:UDPglucose 6-dehydrogenase
MDATAGVEQVGSVEEALSGADAAVLVTEWAELADTDWAEAASQMGGEVPVFVDGRNMLDPEHMRESGWIYESIGRPSA